MNASHPCSWSHQPSIVRHILDVLALPSIIVHSINHDFIPKHLHPHVSLPPLSLCCELPPAAADPAIVSSPRTLLAAMNLISIHQSLFRHSSPTSFFSDPAFQRLEKFIRSKLTVHHGKHPDLSQIRPARSSSEGGSRDPRDWRIVGLVAHGGGTTGEKSAFDTYEGRK